ncbi:MAG: dTMP kinase [Patescibacteria group bacterium]
MENNPYAGKFIVFEGPDGSGQSTQAALLKDFLIKQEYNVILTKEPTRDSEAGKQIRQILDTKITMESQKIQELFAQDRKEHLENLIIPALKESKIVISDRYFFSTFAFGVSDGLDLEKLISLNNNFLYPDIVFELKVNPEICIQRIEKRGEGIKLFEKIDKLTKVWQVYETLSKRFENVYIIDGEKTIEEVFSQVKNIIANKLK